MEALLSDETLSVVVQLLLHDDPDAQAAHAAMIERGMTKADSKDEIARAILGWGLEYRSGVSNGRPEVFRRLRDGETTADLFPYLYGSGGNQPN